MSKISNKQFEQVKRDELQRTLWLMFKGLALLVLVIGVVTLTIDHNARFRDMSDRVEPLEAQVQTE